MYGYQMDYVHEGRLQLKLTRDEAVRAEELDQHPIRMLQHVAVPHILKLDVSVIDNEAAFYYDLSGKRLLYPLLTVESIHELQYYEWLLQLIRILEDCHDYMLQANQVLIDERSLYIEGSIHGGKLYVPYIPVIEAIYPRAAFESLQRIAIRLSNEVHVWNSNGFQGFMRLIHREDVSFVQLREYIQSLIVPPSQLQQQTLRNDPLLYPADSSKDALGTELESMQHLGTRRHEQVDHWMQSKLRSVETGSEQLSTWDWKSRHSSEPEGWKEYNRPSTATGRGNKEEGEPIEEAIVIPSEDNASAPQSWILTIGIVLAFALFGWKFGFGRSPSAAGFILSMLFTMVGAGIGYVWRTGKLLSLIKQCKILPANNSVYDDPADLIPDMASEELTTHLKSRSSLSHKLFRRTPMPPLPKESSSEASESSFFGSAQPARDKQSWYQSDLDQNELKPQWKHSYSASEDENDHLSAHTTLLGTGESNPTMLLDRSLNPIQPVTPVLEHVSGSSLLGRHLIQQMPYRIGRADKGIELSIQEPGISKLHCELIFEEGQYYIQDLGSKNGTELAGQLLIPYKKMLLQSGDPIRMASHEYRFSLV